MLMAVLVALYCGVATTMIATVHAIQCTRYAPELVGDLKLDPRSRICQNGTSFCSPITRPTVARLARRSSGTCSVYGRCAYAYMLAIMFPTGERETRTAAAEAARGSCIICSRQTAGWPLLTTALGYTYRSESLYNHDLIVRQNHHLMCKRKQQLALLVVAFLDTTYHGYVDHEVQKRDDYDGGDPTPPEDTLGLAGFQLGEDLCWVRQCPPCSL